MKIKPVMKRFGPPTCANCRAGRSAHSLPAVETGPGVMSHCGNWKARPSKLVPAGAVIEVNDGKDAVLLAHLLSYARRVSYDGLDPTDQKKADRMLQQLAGALEALNYDAACHLEERTGVYHQTRKLFDPDWSEA